MMVRPRQNLPSESQQWVRSIESDVDQAIRTQLDKDATLNNTLSGLANSVANLGGLVSTLTAQQAQLTAQQAQIAAQQSQLVSTVNQLTAQQNYLSSLKSKDASVGYWSDNTFTADSQWHWDSATPTVTLAVPTGKVRIIVKATNALASTNVSTPGLLRVGLTYSVSGGVANAGGSVAYVSSEIGNNTGAPIVHIATVTMPPGTYQFIAYRGYFCTTNGTNKAATLDDTTLIVEVINSD